MNHTTNILFLNWPCFGKDDILEFFQKRGYQVTKYYHEDYDKRQSDTFSDDIEKIFLSSEFDFCFSYNYFPLLARACYKHNLKYISFVYDNPQVKLYSYTVTYPTNYIFCFDSYEVDHFRKNGLTNFYYMPLPVNANKIDDLLQQPYDKEHLASEVSFVGSLYDEDHNFLDNMTGLSDRTRGFLSGIMDAQLKVSGYNFIEECLTPEIINELQKNAQYHPCIDGTESLSYIFSDYFICRKLTNLERTKLLSLVAEKYQVKLFTLNAHATLPNVQNIGSADYYMEMPYIFHDSKINLNITLRSIRNGIPLRCMDIMANGGFLLTNFQSDFLYHFVPDEDFVYYESEKDLLHKIDYYLSHDKERRAIAESGHAKVCKYHNYDTIWNQILEIVMT